MILYKPVVLLSHSWFCFCCQLLLSPVFSIFNAFCDENRLCESGFADLNQIAGILSVSVTEPGWFARFLTPIYEVWELSVGQ